MKCMNVLLCFLSSQGEDSYHRQRVINANSKKDSVVLNQPDSGASKHLNIINTALSDLSAKHPITRVTELLHKLKC